MSALPPETDIYRLIEMLWVKGDIGRFYLITSSARLGSAEVPWQSLLAHDRNTAQFFMYGIKNPGLKGFRGGSLVKTGENAFSSANGRASRRLLTRGPS
jgi:hypothetical protein